MAAAVMAQPGFSLTAPSSRQDIISALLDDYGSISPYAMSPVPAFKELPPPPAPSKNEKPLPPILTMKFQLRVDEPSNPNTRRGSNDTDTSPTRIVWRSMSRGSKPASLKLTKSNGSTAALPPLPLNINNSNPPASPPPPAPVEKDTVRAKPLPGKVLPAVPDLPPPPPRKSSLRQEMGNKISKIADASKEKTEKQDAPIGSIKRRPVPSSSSDSGKDVGKRCYPTLADLSRGRKGVKPVASTEQAPQPVSLPVPEPEPSTSTNEASHTDATELSEETNATSLAQETTLGTTIEIETPPPDEDVKSPVLPAPVTIPEESPSKYGIRNGSPEVKGEENAKSPVSAKQTCGKTSTGFEKVKATSRFQTARAFLNTLTPSPTPSPTTPPPATLPPPAPPKTAPEAQLPAEAAPLQARPSSQTQLLAHLGKLPSPASTPTTKTLESINARRPSSTTAPLLRQIHLECYHNHARFHRSINKFAPVACMTCYKEEGEERWSCTWCCLRVCGGCRMGLEKVDKRDLGGFLESRGGGKEKVGGGGPGVVVWES